MSECPFCQIIAGKAPGRKVYEDEQTLAIPRLHPSPAPLSRHPRKHVSGSPTSSRDDGIADPFLKTCYVIARKIKPRIRLRYVTMLIAAPGSPISTCC